MDRRFQRAFRKARTCADSILYDGGLAHLTSVMGPRGAGDDAAVPPRSAWTMLWRHLDNPEGKRDYAAALKKYANKVFDFRKTRQGEQLVERWDAEKVRFSHRQLRAIHSASRSLRMTGFHRPSRKSFDLGLVLGGKGPPVLLRMVHLHALMDGRHGKKVSFDKIGLMGCQREVKDPERQDMWEMVERLPDLAIKVDKEYARQRIASIRTEFDVMSVAAEIVFGLRPGQSNDRVQQHGVTEHTQSIVRNLGTAEGFRPSFTVISAPSSDASRRANTADTYAFANEVPELKLNGRGHVAVVNTQLFRFQEADAHRMFGLRSGHEIEMCGYPYRPPYIAADDPRVHWEKGFHVFQKELRAVEKRQNRVLRRVGFSRREAHALHEQPPENRKAILQSRGIKGEELDIVMKGETRLMSFHGAARNMLQEINSAVNQGQELAVTLDRSLRQGIEQAEPQRSQYALAR
jgi:hypothetical protein